MSQTTPDIRQLCPDCGGRINWEEFQDEQGTLYMGRCGLRCGWEILDIPKPERPLTATEDLLLARIAELEAANAELLATLANERGEGEAPVEGWVVVRNPMGPPARCWWWERHLVMVYRAESGAWTRNEYVPGKGTIATSTHETARDAMRAASSQGADVPKSQP